MNELKENCGLHQVQVDAVVQALQYVMHQNSFFFQFG